MDNYCPNCGSTEDHIKLHPCRHCGVAPDVRPDSAAWYIQISCRNPDCPAKPDQCKIEEYNMAAAAKRWNLEH